MVTNKVRGGVQEQGSKFPERGRRSEQGSKFSGATLPPAYFQTFLLAKQKSAQGAHGPQKEQNRHIVLGEILDTRNP